MQTFREVAFYKTRKRRTASHYITVGGSIYVGVSIVAALFIVLFALKNFN